MYNYDSVNPENIGFKRIRRHLEDGLGDCPLVSAGVGRQQQPRGSCTRATPLKNLKEYVAVQVEEEMREEG